jgi:hypothetical protein
LKTPISSGSQGIILGRLKGVGDNSHNSAKVNAIINSFWVFNYIIRGFREKAEECCIEVEEKSEYKTSSKCPRCRSENITSRGKSLQILRLWAGSGTVGVLNIGCLRGGSVVAHSLPLR